MGLHIVVRIALGSCIDPLIRRVLLYDGRFRQDTSHSRQNAIQDLVDIWDRRDVQQELAQLRTWHMAFIGGELEAVQARFRECIAGHPVDPALLLPAERTSPLLRDSGLVRDMGSAGALLGTRLCLGARPQWEKRLSKMGVSVQEVKAANVEETALLGETAKVEEVALAEETSESDQSCSKSWEIIPSNLSSRGDASLVGEMFESEQRNNAEQWRENRQDAENGERELCHKKPGDAGNDQDQARQADPHFEQEDSKKEDHQPVVAAKLS